MHTIMCKHCNKIFLSKYRTCSCNDCKQLDANRFDDIEAYLKEYPNSNALQISEELEIPVYTIIKYMQEGRLLVSKGTFHKLD